jgi:hypothetical protein
MTKFMVVLVMVLLLPGCASMYQTSQQNIVVSTNNDVDHRATTCKLTNEEGTWKTKPGLIVRVERDGNPMDVECENKTQAGKTTVSPEFVGSYLGLDLMLDLCLISCIVDGATNSWYRYPDFIPVDMKLK